MRALPLSLLVAVFSLLSVGCKRTAPEVPASAGPGPVEACVDRWLSAHKLDPYGSPEGTMYAGGTPLFDERTGEQKDRLTFVFERHPEARAECLPAGAGRDGGAPTR